MKQKIITTTQWFDRQIKKLSKKWLYTEEEFIKDIKLYVQNENEKTRRKHKINLWWNKIIWSISLDDDLRTFYFHIHETSIQVEYVFFKIGNHDDVY